MNNMGALCQVLKAHGTLCRLLVLPVCPIFFVCGEGGRFFWWIRKSKRKFFRQRERQRQKQRQREHFHTSYLPGLWCHWEMGFFPWCSKASWRFHAPPAISLVFLQSFINMFCCKVLGRIIAKPGWLPFRWETSVSVPPTYQPFSQPHPCDGCLYSLSSRGFCKISSGISLSHNQVLCVCAASALNSQVLFF